MTEKNRFIHVNKIVSEKILSYFIVHPQPSPLLLFLLLSQSLHDFDEAISLFLPPHTHTYQHTYNQIDQLFTSPNMSLFLPLSISIPLFFSLLEKLVQFIMQSYLIFGGSSNSTWFDSYLSNYI